MSVSLRDILFFIALTSTILALGGALWWVLAALFGLIGAQTVFWIWTFPANQATQNWTTIPDNWETLRRNWEYSHLAGAIFQLICAVGLIVAILSRRPAPHPGEIEIHGPGPVEST